MQASRGAATVLEKLNSHGFEAYLVGGCVRDHLMGRPCSDYDITTNALPEQMLEVFKGLSVIPTGIKHGTVTVLTPEPIEVTTYRVDGSYADSRHPDKVSFTGSLKEDLARRDLTVNAIAFGKDGYVDIFGGMDDIKNKIIRTVGDPRERFGEDALRILRAVRFSSQLGFTVESETADAARDMAHTLCAVSAERKLAELNKLLIGKNAYNALMDHYQVICAVIPQLKDCVDFDQKSRHHHYDLYRHICLTVANSSEALTVRMAALLHDIAKPECYYCDERGGHFPDHAEKSAEIAVTVLKRLRADGKTLRDVAALIKNHRDIPQNDVDIKYLLNRLGKERTMQLYDLMLADSASKKVNVGFDERILASRQRTEQLLKDGVCYGLDGLDVNGRDIEALGMRGEAVGRALQLALDGVIKGKIRNCKKEILEYIMKSEGNNYE